MIVFSVEEDWGHLMIEHLTNQQYQTAVRGHCFSCIMPWEDILNSLQESMSD